MTMLAKIKELIEVMKENDVRSIDFYGGYPDVRIEGTTILKAFDSVQVEPSEDADGIFHVEAVVDGIAFNGAVTDDELAEYQKAKEVA